MSEPVSTFEPLPGGGYVFALLDEGVRVEVRYLRREFKQLHAEMDVLCDWAGASASRRSKHSISCADLNLSSQTARSGRAKYCAERSKSKPEIFDWPGVIDEACRLVIQAERAGSTPIILDDAPDVTEQNFHVDGLQIPADAASMMIAHGDSLKSLLLLRILGRLAEQGRRVLMVDYEWTPARHAARKRRLFGPTRLETLRYLRCHAPLTLEVDAIRRYCDEHQIEFIGLDSVGLACDGKLSDDDTAIRFHRALATLPPALCAAHVPKSSLGPDGKGDANGAFGSVFFSNLCRTSWLVKKQSGTTDDIVIVGCFPQKQNDGPRTQAIGLEFTFTPSDIVVRPVDLAHVDGLAERLPLAARMIQILKRGPSTYAEIAEELDAKVDSIVKAAKRSDAFTKVPGKDGITRLALVERRVA